MSIIKKKVSDREKFKRVVKLGKNGTSMKKSMRKFIGMVISQSFNLAGG